MATRPAEAPRATGWPRARAAGRARRRGKFSTLSISGAVALLVLVIAGWSLVTALTTIPTFVIPTPASVWRALVGGFALPLTHPGGWGCTSGSRCGRRSAGWWPAACSGSGPASSSPRRG